jgi:2-keto-3-deoxy-L-fuconate dehydrogenase
MTGRLHGKRALCTAAGQGIGRATAVAFAREGAEVIATDVDEFKLDTLADDGVAATFRLDVTDSQAVHTLAASLGGVDVLFNCAGIVHEGSVLECSEEVWDLAFDLNAKSMHRTIRAFLPNMIERAKGSGRSASIINIASAVSSLKAAPSRYVYMATKSAVIGLTKSVAIDFIRQGVRCNAICPGVVRSPSWEERVDALAKELGSRDEALERFVSRQPMGRVGEPEEIAALAVHLASDESAFTTGAVIAVDGGQTL